MRVAVLSHRSGNIGHAIMATGVEEIVRNAFGNAAQIEHFEQHLPFSVLPEGHPARALDERGGRRQSLLRNLATLPLTSRLFFWRTQDLSRFQLAIACGGPNIISAPNRSPYFKLLFHEMYGAFARQGVPVADVAAGSGGFSIEKFADADTYDFDDEARAFYAKSFAATRITTSRDAFCQRLLRTLGRETELIPCTAMASGRYFERMDGAGQTRDVIAINYQKFGANETWGTQVDPDAWRETIGSLANRLSRRHKIVFVAHSDAELALAREAFTHFPSVKPATIDEYGIFTQKIKSAVVSRIHAALPLAGVGVASVGIGTDTRLGTLQHLGLPTVPAQSATAEQLEAQVEELLTRFDVESDRLHAVREASIARYSQILCDLV